MTHQGACHPRRPRVREHHPRGNARQGRLSCAVGSYQGHPLASFQAQAKTIEGAPPLPGKGRPKPIAPASADGVILDEILSFQCGRHIRALAEYSGEWLLCYQVGHPAGRLLVSKGRLHTREDSGIVLDREGRWLHDGEPVEHPKIIDAFNRGIERAPDGRYVLRFGGDWCFITVEGAPLQVLQALIEPGGVRLKLSNGKSEPLAPQTLSTWEGVLYCVTASGMAARFSRAAQSALAPLLRERAGGFELEVDSQCWPVPEKKPRI
jgi:hypothetical protein